MVWHSLNIHSNILGILSSIEAMLSGTFILASQDRLRFAMSHHVADELVARTIELFHQLVSKMVVQDNKYIRGINVVLKI